MNINFAVTTITVFSIITCVVEVSNATSAKLIAQIYPTKQNTTPRSNQIPLNRTNQQLDLPLLARTCTNFWQRSRYQTESQMQLGGSSQGVEFNAYAQIRTIAQSDGKFRAEIAFTRPGEQAKSPTLVISNGKQVTIYRPDLQQYSVTTYQAFDKSNQSYLIGIPSFMFLQIPEDTRRLIAGSQLSDKKILQQLGLSIDQTLKGYRRTVNGQVFYVYSYTDPKAGYTFNTFVQPQTATVNQVQLSGKSQGLDIFFVERILSRTENPVVTDQSFRFLPPKSAKPVKSLSITPF